MDDFQDDLNQFVKWLDGDVGFDDLSEAVQKAVDELIAEDEADFAKGSYTPPEGVRAAAKRALAWIADGKAGDGFTSVGRNRAQTLAAGNAIGMDTVKRMSSFFARHEVDKKATGFSQGEDGYPSAGRVAWDAWGGDAGWSWVKGIVNSGDVEKGDPTMEDVHQGQANTPKKKRKPAMPEELLHKASEEHQFTLGPWYIPDKEDAHSEWTDANELQKALWDYVKSGDRNIRLQHNKDVVAGEWVEAMSFPVPVTLGMTKASGEAKEVTYPAGTVFLGVKWNDWAWDLVKQNKITGFSIGGSAARVAMSLPQTATPILENTRKAAAEFVAPRPKAEPVRVTLKDAMRALIDGEDLEPVAPTPAEVLRYNGVDYEVVPLTKRFNNGVVNVAGLYGSDQSVTMVRTDGERFWASGSGSLANLPYAKAQIVFATVASLAKAKSFGGNRSAAGTYAANIRWAKHSENPEVQHQVTSRQFNRANPRGPYADATTPEGKIVQMTYDSLTSHVDFDALAADMKASGHDFKHGGEVPSYDMLRKHMSPERAALHDKIIESHFVMPDGTPKTPPKLSPTDQPEYVFMGGGPAAGKTSMLKAGHGPEWAGDGTNGPNGTNKHSVAVNADEIKGGLPPYQRLVDGKGGRVGQMAAASIVHEESSLLSKVVNQRATQGGFNVLLDGTGDNNPKSMAGKIEAARKSKGTNGRPYYVTGLYATVPTGAAVERARLRGLPKGTPYTTADGYSSKGEGRYVARAVVIKTHQGVSRVFPEVSGAFDKVTLLDTSGRPPKLIAEGTRGRRLLVRDRAAYDTFLGKATEVVE